MMRDDEGVSDSSNRPPNPRSGNPAKRAAADDARSQPAPASRPRGYRLLAWLHRQPKWLVPVLTVLLTLGGLFLPSVWGGACLLVVAAFLGWLASLAWPRLGVAARMVRVAVITLVVAVAAARIAGLWGA